MLFPGVGVLLLKLAYVGILLAPFNGMGVKNPSPIEAANLCPKSFSDNELSGGNFSTLCNSFLKLKSSVNSSPFDPKERANEAQNKSSLTACCAPFPARFYGQMTPLITADMTAEFLLKELNYRFVCIGDSNLDPMGAMGSPGLVNSNNHMPFSIKHPSDVSCFGRGELNFRNHSLAYGAVTTFKPTGNGRVRNTVFNSDFSSGPPLCMKTFNGIPVFLRKILSWRNQVPERYFTPLQPGNDCADFHTITVAKGSRGSFRLVTSNNGSPNALRKAFAGAPLNFSHAKFFKSHPTSGDFFFQGKAA